MDKKYHLSDAERAGLLAQLALAWDGQWFLKTHEEAGWEAAARLNARVRQSFGRIEMRMLLRALGKRRADSVADAVSVLETYYSVVLSDGFRGAFQVEGDTVYVRVDECAALAGSKRAGLERSDQACVGCARLFRVYFETLLPGRVVEIETLGQMGYGAEACQYVIRVGSA